MLHIWCPKIVYVLGVKKELYLLQRIHTMHANLTAMNGMLDARLFAIISIFEIEKFLRDLSLIFKVPNFLRFLAFCM